jgi:hypothetical protein
LADDTKIYGTLTGPEDTRALQLDIIALKNWAQTGKKSLILKITHERDKIYYF